MSKDNLAKTATDIEKRLEEEQHDTLRHLRDVLEDVLNSEPLDSGDEEEDYIWETANTLKDALDGFFEEDADSTEEESVVSPGFTHSDLYILFSTLDTEVLYRSIDDKALKGAVTEQEYNQKTAEISELWTKILQSITDARHNRSLTTTGFTHDEMCLLASVLDSAISRLTEESKGIKNVDGKRDCMQEIAERVAVQRKVKRYLESVG